MRRVTLDEEYGYPIDLGDLMDEVVVFALTNGHRMVGRVVGFSANPFGEILRISNPLLIFGNPAEDWRGQDILPITHLKTRKIVDIVDLNFTNVVYCYVLDSEEKEFYESLTADTKTQKEE